MPERLSSTKTYVPQPGERLKFIGASDAAAVLGLSPWVTPYDLWAEKTGRVTRDEETEATRAGRIFEISVLNWAEEKLGTLERDLSKLEIIPEGLGFPLRVHLDAMVQETGDPVEAKTTGLFSPVHPDWGSDETDEIPQHVIIQNHVQLIATKKDLCHVPAFLGGTGFCMYHTRGHADLQQMIVDACGQFWNDCVLKDTPPADSTISLHVAKKLKRLEGERVQIDGSLLDLYEEARECAKNAEETKKGVLEDILTALGDAEIGEAEDGRLFTYFEQTRKAYEVAAATFRVPRIKKAKK